MKITSKPSLRRPSTNESRVQAFPPFHGLFASAPLTIAVAIACDHHRSGPPKAASPAELEDTRVFARKPCVPCLEVPGARRYPRLSRSESKGSDRDSGTLRFLRP